MQPYVGELARTVFVLEQKQNTFCLDKGSEYLRD